MTFFRIVEYLRYRWRAKNAHGIHSPFVFDLYNQVLHGSVDDPGIEEKISKRYLQNPSKVRFRDPKVNQSVNTTIRNLARQSWSGKKFSFFLMQLCEWLEAKSFLETGTSLGITISVVAQASGLNKLHSIEGSQKLADLARELNFVPPNKELTIIQGKVQDTFGEILIKADPEVIFLDADHRSETIFFYMDCISRHKKSVKAIVIHDIYWSRDMKKAWNAVCHDPQYPLTIDCFHMGILFPKMKMEKQHFVLRY